MFHNVWKCITLFQGLKLHKLVLFSVLLKWWWVWSTAGMILRWDSGSTERETCPSTTLSTTCLTWTNPGSHLGLYGERPVTNCLSHGTGCPRHDKYLNTQFVPHRKHNNLIYKEHKLNIAYKTNCFLLSIIWIISCFCKMYKFLISQFLVCIICNYWGLKGPVFLL